MWRLYLELAFLVVLAFAVGAVLARVVVRLLVKQGTPDDDGAGYQPRHGAREVTP